MRLALAGGVALVSVAVPVRADEPVHFVIRYAAPSECWTEKMFVSRIVGRTDRARPGSGPGATLLDVRLERVDGEVAGRVRIAEPGSEERVRTLRGASCAEVGDALALIAALALDPDASSEPRPEPAEPEPLPRAAPPRPAPAPARSPPLAWSFGAGALLVPVASALPDTDPGFGVWVDAASQGRTLAPSVRVVLRRLTGTARGRAGSAELALTTGVASICPLRAPADGPLALRPCLGFELGMLDAEGVGVDLPRRPSRLWLAPQLGGRAEWRVHGPLLLAAEAAAQLPLLRPRYAFDTGETVFEVPRLGAFLALEAGLRFE